MVKDINPGTASSAPGNFLVLGSNVYFSASDGVHGSELWKSDGTAAGTVMVSDLNPGLASSSPANLTALGNQLYFSAATVLAGGSEVFVLDLDGPPEIAVEQPVGTDLASGVATIQIGSARIGTLALKTFRVRNSGTGPLSLSDVTIDGPGAAAFSVGNFDGVVVPAGGSTGVTVYFAPTTAGTKSATLHILTNDADESSFDIAITGTGFVAPDIEVLSASGASLIDDVSSVMIGDAPQGLTVSQTFTVRNSGGSTLSLGAVTLDGTNAGRFTMTQPGVTTLAPGTETALTVTFAPNAQAPFRATLHLTSNDPDEASFDFFITGIGSYAPGTLKLSRDINQQGTGTFLSASSTVILGNALLYAATTSDAGTELWKTDGTAAGTTLLKDINPGTSSSSPSNLTLFNGLTYFTATDAVNGMELWKTDGTSAGTVLVKDIFSGGSGSVPTSLRVMNGVLFFAAKDGTYGTELWRSDGTTAGTTMVKNIHPSIASNPAQLLAVGTTLFFTALDGSTGTELWKSDGTAAGTVQVKDVWSGASSSSISLMTAAGSLVFFTANDGANGSELWVSDGTGAGTFMVKDINATAANTGSSIASLRAVGPIMMFTANDGVSGTELWRSDGTAAGTFMVMDISPGSSSSSLSGMTVSGSQLFFITQANGLPSVYSGPGQELWRSDGTSAGTFVVRDISPGYLSSGTNNITADGQGGVYFSASNGGTAPANGNELWHTDGTNLGTVLVKDINPGTGGSSPSNLVMMNGLLYFSASLDTTGTELWRSDGSDSGTYMVRELNAGLGGSSPSVIASSGSMLFALASNGGDGSELVGIDTASSSARQLRDHTTGTSGSFAANVRAINGRVVFAANDGVNGQELWADDGHGAYLLKDIRPGLGSGVATSITPVIVDYLPENSTTPVSMLFFGADDGTSGQELWVTDGTSDGTHLVKELYSGTASGLGPTMANVNGRLFFAGSAQGLGTELWTTDGTEAGTRMVADIWGANSSSSPSGLTAVGATLFFNANNGPDGTELWKSDGTPSGTVMVKNLTGGNGSTTFGGFASARGLLFFVANDGSTVGSELWVSDGTSAGTVLVKDINPTASTASSINSMTAFNDVLYFSANDGSNGTELWRSDGTAAGTYLLKDINSGTANSTPTSFKVVGNTLYFAATTAANGTELWMTDGTGAGTVMVKDIFAGTSSAVVSNFANINGTLYFSATGSTTQGSELWKSDGTSSGTVLVVDLRPGANLSSSPSNITALGSRIFFAATGTDTGNELWSLNLNPQPQLAIIAPDASPLIDGTSVVDIGSIGIGQSSPQTFTLRNDGDAVLSITAVTVTGSNSSEFTCSALPSSLAAAGSTTFTVTFTPSAPGMRTAAVHITSNDPDESPFDIALNGTGLSAQQSWLLQYFGTIASAGNAADDADSDGDGIKNLMEFALNANPTTSSTSALPTIADTLNPTDGKHYLTMTYRRRISPGSLTYTLEGTPDLTTWNPIPGVNLEQVGTAAATGDGVTESVTFRILPSITDSPAPRFVRLSVSQ